MDPAKCKEILTEAAAMGVSEVVFSGGEPLLWNAIDEVVNLAALSGLKTTIYTSGNVDLAENRLRMLHERGLQRTIFTLLGHEAASHEYITRIAGSFSATMAAIKAAAIVGLDVEIHFVAFLTNYRLLQSVAELGYCLGASRVSVLRFVPQGRGSIFTEGYLGRIQFLELRRSIERLRSKGYEIRTGSPLNFLMVNDNPSCRAAVERLIVSPDLRIYPCDAFKQVMAEEIAGTVDLSILDGAGLRECWENSPYLTAVRAHVAGGVVEPCKSCRHLLRCQSGCLAQRTILAGELVAGPDPMCLRSGD